MAASTYDTAIAGPINHAAPMSARKRSITRYHPCFVVDFSTQVQ
jgi:hypothetical protein